MSDFVVSISDLRTRITFQKPTTEKLSTGALKETFVNVDSNPTVWARWINAHGEEVISGDAVKSAQRARVTVRYRSDIQTTWQILKDGQAWQILSVDPVQDRNRWVEMIVERVEGSV